MSLPKDSNKRRRSLIAVIQKNGMRLAHATLEERDNEEIVLAAVLENGEALQFASERIRRGESEKCREIIQEALVYSCPKNSSSDAFLSQNLLSDPTFMQGVLLRNQKCYQFTPLSIRDDQDLLFKLLGESDPPHQHLLGHASHRLRGDGRVMKKVIELGPPLVLEDFSEELLANRDLMLHAVTVDGTALQYASDTLKNDREVVRTAVSSAYRGMEALQYASTERRADRDIVYQAAKTGGGALEFSAVELGADKDIVLAAVQHNDGWKGLRDAAPQLQADGEVVVTAVQHCADAWQYAAEATKWDRAILLEALKHDFAMKISGAIFEHSEEFQNDREMAMAAVSACGASLRWITKNLRKDREVVALAVQTGPGDCGKILTPLSFETPLKFAEGELQQDPKLLTMALENVVAEMGGRQKDDNPPDDWLNLIWPCIRGERGSEIRNNLAKVDDAIVDLRKRKKLDDDNFLDSKDFLKTYEREYLERIWLVKQMSGNYTPLPDRIQWMILEYDWTTDPAKTVTTMRDCARLLDTLALCNGFSFSEQSRLFVADVQGGELESEEEEDEYDWADDEYPYHEYDAEDAYLDYLGQLGFN
jgi:hypothetical protein